MKAQRHLQSIVGNMQHTSTKRQPKQQSSEFSNYNVSVLLEKTRDVFNAVLVGLIVILSKIWNLLIA
jgi:hypothetical protein